MKNSEKARIYDLINYMTDHHHAIVEIKYDEITVSPHTNTKIMAHTHERYNSENMVEVLVKLCTWLDNFHQQNRNEY